MNTFSYALLSMLTLLTPPSTAAETPGVALVELYTSQGCSSCPAADRVLAKWQGKASEGVFLLAFHVDYWDYLGWRDPFGSKSYSTRQREQAQALGERVYTPQMVINGEKALVGSKEASALTLLKEALARPVSVKLTLTVEELSPEQIRVNHLVTTALPQGAVLHFALAEDGLQTPVPRGENSGKKLYNTGVVRGYHEAPLQERGSIVLSLAKVSAKGQCRVIAWVTAGAYGTVLGAQALKLQQ